MLYISYLEYPEISAALNAMEHKQMTITVVVENRHPLGCITGKCYLTRDNSLLKTQKSFLLLCLRSASFINYSYF